jgi:hypothetical protein
MAEMTLGARPVIARKSPHLAEACCGSTSTTTVRKPISSAATARFNPTVVLPVPPFRLAIARTTVIQVMPFALRFHRITKKSSSGQLMVKRLTRLVNATSSFKFFLSIILVLHLINSNYGQSCYSAYEHFV